MTEKSEFAPQTGTLYSEGVGVQFTVFPRLSPEGSVFAMPRLDRMFQASVPVDSVDGVTESTLRDTLSRFSNADRVADSIIAFARGSARAVNEPVDFSYNYIHQ